MCLRPRSAQVAMGIWRTGHGPQPDQELLRHPSLQHRLRRTGGLRNPSREPRTFCWHVVCPRMGASGVCGGAAYLGCDLRRYGDAQRHVALLCVAASCRHTVIQLCGCALCRLDHCPRWRGLAGDLVSTYRTEKVQPGNAAVELAVRMTAGSLLGRLHPQRVVKTVEVIEQSDGRQQFNDLAFVIVTAQFSPKVIIHFVRVASNTLSQFERGFFGLSEIGTIAKVGQVLELVVVPAVPPCQGGVGRQSILAAVDL